MEEIGPDLQQYPQRRTAVGASADAAVQAGAVSDETDLFARGAGGDAAAQRAIVDRHGHYLFGVAHALTRDPHDAEDLVQETLFGAFRSKFRGEASLRTWLVKILVRQAAMLRRSRKRSALDVSLENSEVGAAGGTDAATGATNIADAKLDLTAMLATLSPEHRHVIVLREVEQLSYDEMSKALGVPRGTVESRLHRARDELRKRFKGYM
jgi:RNA polymerase sigma-70 factor (ECF subfamily)